MTNKKIPHCQMVRGEDIRPGMKVSVVPAKRGLHIVDRTFRTVVSANEITRLKLCRKIELRLSGMHGRIILKSVNAEMFYLRKVAERRPKIKANRHG